MDEAQLLMTRWESLDGKMQAAAERLMASSGRPTGDYLADEEDWD